MATFEKAQISLSDDGIGFIVGYFDSLKMMRYLFGAP